MTLEEARARIGEPVAYRPRVGAKPEFGTITSVNDAFVFVRYGADVGSKATRPEDLRCIRWDAQDAILADVAMAKVAILDAHAQAGGKCPICAVLIVTGAKRQPCTGFPEEHGSERLERIADALGLAYGRVHAIRAGIDLPDEALPSSHATHPNPWMTLGRELLELKRREAR